MHRPDKPEDTGPDAQRSQPRSRRNSATLSRRSSLTKEKETRKSSLSTAPNSATSTPKKTITSQNVDLVVTGRQLLKRSDRANSSPGAYHRRQSIDAASRTKAGLVHRDTEPKSEEGSLEDDMSLDLSQVSDFEDYSSKYGCTKFKALATSTPKSHRKPRSTSVHSQLHTQKLECQRRMASETNQGLEPSKMRTPETTRDTSVDSTQRFSELDYSSVSPEYSGQSSEELSPSMTMVMSPQSQELQVSSCCVSTWQDSERKKLERTPSEWDEFWANYNNSLAKVPIKRYYDQCPTPYRTETFDVADFEFSDGSRKKSPDDMQSINNIICNEGLHFTPRETQNIIKCAHMLGNVLSKAIERRSKIDTELPEKKRDLTLDLKETNLPVEVKEEKRTETVTTQTDISLPNTKTAPRIFEKILRQLSRNSIEVEKNDKKEADEEKKEE